MPILAPSYTPPLGIRNGHFQTVLPTIFRVIRGVRYQRERITTPDGDFLDLDWTRVDSPRLVVLCHGLEGCSSRAYIKGMARACNRRGWDVLAWNYRSCSGEINRTLRFYHMGATEDLECVLEHVRQSFSYEKISMVGFSMGGNLILKYLGERPFAEQKLIHRAVAFSVPCDLQASAEYLARPQNTIYMKRFIKMFRAKIEAKAKLFPGQISAEYAREMTTFREWDEYYTAPLHGFKNAEDYWEKCSSIGFIPQVKIPTLLVNARNDPFLPRECYPDELAKASENFVLEMPKSGGHVGFMAFNLRGEFWSEQRATEFLALG